MMSILRWLEYATAALLHLAPARFRDAFRADILDTLRSTCLAAHRERGWPGLVFAGITELGSIGSSAVKERVGGGAGISGGGSRPDPGKSPRARIGAMIANDLRLASRSILAGKLSASIAVVTLALGIGVNAAVFSIFDAVILHRMPFAHTDRLDEIWAQDPKQGFSTPRVNVTVIREWRKQTDLFERVEAYDISSHIYQSQRGAEMVTGTVVTPGLLPMLGVAPLMGRTFVDGDGRGGTDALIVLSETFWTEFFLRDPQIVGKTMAVNGIGHTVVGVMPRRFHFPNERSKFWLPLDVDAPPANRTHLPQALNMFSLRRADVTTETVATAVTARGEGLWRAAGATRIWTAKMRGNLGNVDVDTKTSLYVLAGAVGFLLLIVCANVANLSLSRTLARARDFAVRASLGASRRDLIRESLVENGLIGAIGAAAGLLIAAATLEVVRAVLPATFALSSMNPIDLDGRVLAFTAAIAVLTPLLFGLAPALMASKTSVVDALKSDSRSSTGTPASRRLRGALVIAEVSLAIVLLTGTALMARSVFKLNAVDRGFDTRGLVTLRVGLPAAGYADPYARDGFVERMIDHVRRLPGITAATAGAVPPESSLISFGKLEIAGAPVTLTEELILPIYTVWPGYFQITGIPIRAGREFAPGDPLASVIVSESFAKKHFPGGDAVGAQFRFEGAKSWRTIIGVAGEVRQLDLDDKHGSFEFYYPMKRPAGVTAPAEHGEAIVEYRTIVARAADAPATLDRLRQSVHEVDPNVVVWLVQTVDHEFADAIARPRMILVMLAVLGGLGLVLATAGIYGVLSYGVAQRRREIGIRLALGARPQSVGRLIMRHGLVLTTIGLAIGLVAALGLVRVMRTLLYEVEPTDPLSVAGVALLLLMTAVVASWRPARQAMRVDPVSLLRE